MRRSDRRRGGGLIVSAAALLAAVTLAASCGGGDDGGEDAASSTTGTLPPIPLVPDTLVPAPAPELGEAAGTTIPPIPTDEASETTKYVSPDGDDSEDGQTVATAFATLTHALATLEPGDTLYLLGGEYTSDSSPEHFQLSKEGRADAWITIAAYPGDRPRIVGSLGTALQVIYSAFVEVSGIDFVGEGFGPDNPYGYGMEVSFSRYVRLIGNTFSDFPVAGIGIASSTHVLVEGNVVSGNAFWSGFQGSGISFWQPDAQGLGNEDTGYANYFIGNVIHGNENKVPGTDIGFPDDVTDGNGIIVDQSEVSGYPNRTLIANNLVYDNGGPGVKVFQSAHVDVVNNTTYGNGRTPDILGGGAELTLFEARDVRYINNLAWALPGLPVLREDASSGIEQLNNLFVGDDTGSAAETDLTSATDPGLVDPGTDPATADFRLAPGSMAIDAGSPDIPELLTADIEGNPRKGGGAVDIGAFETGG